MSVAKYFCPTVATDDVGRVATVPLKFVYFLFTTLSASVGVSVNFLSVNAEVLF